MDDKVGGMISSTTWSGAVMAVTGTLTLTDWMAVVGCLCAVGGYISNVLHKREMRRLARLEIELKYGNKG
ncbi:HP1 family phage holin [uncultured Pelagimonas sp.]|uniref:HP1 family phage holin n=1 Tax=uncultured Pelagimonas sp. TaxID=1618102 RepID=UPI0026112DA1|nr:HP1 family phage holin [uncultured Pelagimonas sp.]